MSSDGSEYEINSNFCHVLCKAQSFKKFKFYSYFFKLPIVKSYFHKENFYIFLKKADKQQNNSSEKI